MRRVLIDCNEAQSRVVLLYPIPSLPSFPKGPALAIRICKALPVPSPQTS